ncbi:multicopper oxidase family protein [Legionella israelensis]|uniref:Multicopper oxidase n=1 Tax=Legionella israelensis TaxID=454 RepID=A0A0W0VH39_9GAMM|nr:multicopper oxidase family protein [Legionella israelensis]KTD19459.1 Multicopper oxidase [Legionella israelensis]QBS08399.1 multicopper oxidase family protein [Legionella israelensis]SCX92187.1 Multicopper oxidase with three cupredoxin domains (includes cell division protein FtsP and spore coat protein CotA) [Legionella israelensis DSM 19235]STX58033.1 Multicopper oxidase [Legionella israelensis]
MFSKSRFTILIFAFFLFSGFSGLLNAVALKELNQTKAKPTTISVSEIDFQLDGKGKKTRVFDLSFTHPDGSKDNKGYFANKGEMFYTIVKNKTSKPITIHWHGLIVPSAQDGVPYVSQLPLAPGESKVFNFRLLQAGTYWMHSHVGFQEQIMLSAPLIIHDPQEENKEIQEVIMFLEDFTYKDPEKIFEKMRNMKMVSSATQKKTVSTNSDINDVEYDAFLTNKKTLAQPDVIDVKPGKKVRLRIINASSATNYRIDLGQLKGALIAVDGENVHPVQGSDFPIGIANRIDVLVDIPQQGGAFPILALAEGTNQQTGLILKTENASPPEISPTAEEMMGRVKYYELEKQLKTKNPLPVRKVDKQIKLVLGGDMNGYKWTINNQSWPNITPNVINFGDRVEIIYENKTSMSHPMHFHGHVYQVTEIDGKPIQGGAVRDTILVQPNSTVKVQFDALNPGVWVNHCHNLYHLNAGMLTTIQYQHYPKPDFYLKKNRTKKASP